MTTCSTVTAPEWQPIDTAPKDGTNILVIFDCASVVVVHIAWWIPEKVRGPEHAGWWSYTRGSVSQERLEGYRTPTHWMPLPDTSMVTR